MNVEYQNKYNSLTIFIDGDLDECSANNTKIILDNIINDNPNVNKVVFNLSKLNFMDSTGIGLLIGRYKKIKSFGIPAYITGASTSCEKVIELSNIYSIMPKC